MLLTFKFILFLTPVLHYFPRRKHSFYFVLLTLFQNSKSTKSKNNFKIAAIQSPTVTNNVSVYDTFQIAAIFPTCRHSCLFLLSSEQQRRADMYIVPTRDILGLKVRGTDASDGATVEYK